jgi:hypothetical protein
MVAVGVSAWLLEHQLVGPWDLVYDVPRGAMDKLLHRTLAVIHSDLRAL